MRVVFYWQLVMNELLVMRKLIISRDSFFMVS